MLGLALAATPALAQSGSGVSVTFNGNPLSLTPPPIERAGHVFVPLRGIFERLGASVVYSNGTINAQSQNRSISLHVGSNRATIDGQPANLSEAPFVVGASTYVPLRFVSEALGASVNYDAANKIVAINGAGGNGNGDNRDAAGGTSQASSIRLGALEPQRNATVGARRPTIEATFDGGKADPNSLHVSLDQLDITSQTSRSPSGFVYSPPSDLQSTRHEVVVTGTDRQGQPFRFSWSFTSGESSVQNSLTGVRPGDGDTVGQRFTVSGHTLPGANVVVQVGTTGGSSNSANSVANALGQILGYGGSGQSSRDTTTADANGNFSVPVSLGAPSGTALAIVVSSTDPQTHAAARPVQRSVTVR